MPLGKRQKLSAHVCASGWRLQAQRLSLGPTVRALPPGLAPSWEGIGAQLGMDRRTEGLAASGCRVKVGECTRAVRSWKRKRRGGEERGEKSERKEKGEKEGKYEDGERGKERGERCREAAGRKEEQEGRGVRGGGGRERGVWGCLESQLLSLSLRILMCSGVNESLHK